MNLNTNMLGDILFSSEYSSTKLLLNGIVNISLPSGTTNNGTATVPHGYGSDELIYFVVTRDTSGSTTNNMILPFSNSNASLIAFANLDQNNLYIRIGTTGFTPFPATTWACEYYIFVP